jgi:hypothetical protein
MLSLAVAPLGCSNTRTTDVNSACEEARISVAEHEESEDTHLGPPGSDYSQWREILTQGYSRGDAAPLVSFLRDWKARSRAISTSVLLQKPAFEQTIYAFYPEFFVSGASQKGTDYLIIQQNISVRLVTGDLVEDFRQELRDGRSHVWDRITISKFDVHDFRPAMHTSKKTVLYLSDTYLDAMVSYLTGKDKWEFMDSYRDEPNGLDENLNGSKELLDRFGYLKQRLDISLGHWGTGWHFETHPYIDVVILNQDLKSALIYYRNGCGGGIALMLFDEKGWRVDRGKGTWEE